MILFSLSPDVAYGIMLSPSVIIPLVSTFKHPLLNDIVEREDGKDFNLCGVPMCRRTVHAIRGSPILFLIITLKLVSYEGWRVPSTF